MPLLADFCKIKKKKQHVDITKSSLSFSFNSMPLNDVKKSYSLNNGMPLNAKPRFFRHCRIKWKFTVYIYLYVFEKLITRAFHRSIYICLILIRYQDWGYWPCWSLKMAILLSKTLKLVRDSQKQAFPF